MGQSSSSTGSISAAQREAETSAAATGALPTLQKAFSLLSDSQANVIPISSIQKCFTLTIENPTSTTTDEAITVPKGFLELLGEVGSSVVDQFFSTGEGVLDWVGFLTGYNKCCGRTVASTSFNNLFKVFAKANDNAGLPGRVQFDSNEDDSKMDGVLFPTDLIRLLWMCAVLSWDSRKLRDHISKGTYGLPEVDHLVLSAVESCAESADKLDFWNSKVSDLNVQLPAAKIHMWALKTVPCLADCLAHFVYTRLIYLTTQGEKLEDLCFPVHISPKAICNANVLSCGSAWAISLTLRSSITEEVSKVSFCSDVDETNENLLYRSSFHGKGLNRFWSHVEGYNGPVLMLIAASEINNEARRWIIGALTHQGFENRDTFYGNAGSLYSISPAFNVFLSSGKEKNFVYSHFYPTGRVYEANPKSVGIAFGGSVGNERIFLDEDFAKVILRHHAFDKTYQPGSLVPNQGFLPLEGSVLAVEVWGLGGKTAKKVQTSYKKREELFTEQRRKVDLKTFANWEDSPEKMMMDMVSDPSAVRREDR